MAAHQRISDVNERRILLSSTLESSMHTRTQYAYSRVWIVLYELVLYSLVVVLLSTQNSGSSLVFQYARLYIIIYYGIHTTCTTTS